MFKLCVRFVQSLCQCIILHNLMAGALHGRAGSSHEEAGALHVRAGALHGMAGKVVRESERMLEYQQDEL